MEFVKNEQWCIKGHDLQFGLTSKQWFFSTKGIETSAGPSPSPKKRLAIREDRVEVPKVCATLFQTSALSAEAPHTESRGDKCLTDIFLPNFLILMPTLNKVIYPNHAKAQDDAENNIGSRFILTGGGYNFMTS